MTLPSMQRSQRSSVILFNSAKNEPNEVDLLVVRVTKAGEIRMAKPCIDCVDFIRNIKFVRFVYWTDETGTLIGESSTTIVNNHKCRSHRAKLRKLKENI